MMENKRKLTRREALKRMGTLVAGGVAAASGIFPLTSCESPKPRRIIFYFTGTGNCLYVARQLATADTILLSIPQLVKQGQYDFEADEIGIVYPIYGHMPPYMVRQFIQKARLKAGYKFAVLTFGARKCNAVEIWDGITRKAGHAFDYITTLIMVDNWLPNFDMNEQMKLDKHIPENLQRINADLAARRRWHEPVTKKSAQCTPDSWLHRPRPRKGLRNEEREILPGNRPLRGLRHLYLRVPAGQLRTDFTGRKNRRRLRILLCLHTQLPAKSHTVCPPAR